MTNLKPLDPRKVAESLAREVKRDNMRAASAPSPYAQFDDHNAGAPIIVYVQAQPQRRVYKTSHGFHLIMTILTGGLWALFVWLPIGILNASRN